MSTLRKSLFTIGSQKERINEGDESHPVTFPDVRKAPIRGSFRRREPTEAFLGGQEQRGNGVVVLSWMEIIVYARSVYKL
jgi:hypothetical protein